MPENETLAREHLANERTLLSWLRTGMNAIGIGILLYTLVGLTSGAGEFRAIGLALVGFGAVVQATAAARFFQFRVALRRGVPTSSQNVYLLLTFGFVLLAVAYVAYLAVS
ncbi:MAG: YidH family protein [Rubrobacter sp.]